MEPACYANRKYLTFLDVTAETEMKYDNKKLKFSEISGDVEFSLKIYRKRLWPQSNYNRQSTDVSYYVCAKYAPFFDLSSSIYFINKSSGKLNFQDFSAEKKHSKNLDT